jgi:hypothetical protein
MMSPEKIEKQRLEFLEKHDKNNYLVVKSGPNRAERRNQEKTKRRFDTKRAHIIHKKYLQRHEKEERRRERELREKRRAKRRVREGERFG